MRNYFYFFIVFKIFTYIYSHICSVVDFSGSPYSFVELERDFDFKGSWTVDMWVFRDAVIYTQRGKLLSLIAAEDVGGRQTDKGSSLLFFLKNKNEFSCFLLSNFLFSFFF